MKIRPKVRYEGRDGKALMRNLPQLYAVGSPLGAHYSVPTVWCSSPSGTRRIAAALNLAEAVRRGEVKVSK